ncbi:MAG: M1 family peptidase, partial [Elusimicrobia bacterium]|nr:M1 family peptidase [Elusimicrobiota bacterium]
MPATAAEKNRTDKTHPERLSPDIQPESYDLRLSADPDAGTFSGEVSITLRLQKTADRLVLHAAGLNIARAGIGRKEIPLSAVNLDAASETATFRLPEPLPAGTAVLEVSYSGELNRNLRGLYLSTAKHAGKTENYAFTQFEPADARRMLPCFDEPSYKSRFTLAVTAPARYTILSNMPPEKERTEGALKTVFFGQTPRMSTYLLAVAVARLACKKGRVGKTEVAVWTRPEDLDQADFALAAAKASLARLNAYFGLPYELPKMDLVAVPDFAAGAMENWGAIFFRDSAILAHPKLSSAKARRRVAEVVAHEIVHQWFGDLVTMEWWNDLWLNEAFATWLAYKIVDDWKPGWLMWQSFERGKRGALAIDALKNTRPISSDVESVAQIEAQFDMLTYEKGGAILRMLENFLGEKAFRAGLRRYISKYRYKNTQASDLWRELEQASGQPVSKIAADWLTISGYPQIEVSPLSPDNRRLRLVQSRFYAVG